MTKMRIIWLCLIVLLVLILAHSLGAVLGLVGSLAHAIVAPFVILGRFLLIHPILSVFLFGALVWFWINSRARMRTEDRAKRGPRSGNASSADGLQRRFHQKMRGLARDLDRSLSRLDRTLKKRGY